MNRYPMAAVILCSLVAWAQSAPPRPAASSDQWDHLAFLIGTWEAKTTGGSASASGAGTYTFQQELRGRVLARHSNYGSCKGPADFNCEHNDLLYVYEEAPGMPLKAVYFDNEGHVIYYDVKTPAPNTAIFLSSPSRPGPQFRLTYELKDGTMAGKFQIRMPGQSDFKSYLEWTGPPH